MEEEAQAEAAIGLRFCRLVCITFRSLVFLCYIIPALCVYEVLIQRKY